MRLSDLAKERIKALLLVWVLASLLGSVFKSSSGIRGYDNCGKTYPIDYVIATNLFCEIKP
ncbi:hypothetical protein K3H50_04745 [Aeromonas veronii]|uniref:hypothetical protein n=1 Tax=Aeromonas veronii TaxID=654 RepID=UPI001F18DB7D|nr:hypothetical protein [Aeromonas veronii]MCF5862669.1 hypothetical protein [Aeromonas veronii]